MYDPEVLEAMIRTRIVREHLRSAGCAIQTEEGPAACPALWVLRDLAGLLAEFHDRPVDELRPMIHRLIEDQNFVDDQGDAVIDAAWAEGIDRHVDLILGALESVRDEAIAHGDWCDAPLAPLMFG